ncbi:MAG: chloramphenicol phosphotransferase [Armatimonadetes bacterium]|nr:chloramphenicol phosphotransferase [Armatimonadota bacterium]
MSSVAPDKTGTIVILNGTSSSGKSSIVRALQNILEEPYLEAGIDKFIWMLPKRYLNRPHWDEVLGFADKAGPVGQRLVSGMHHAIDALSRAGNNVLAEHVLVEPSWLVDCVRLFGELPALFVGVYCPLEVLEQRERSRKDRTLGQARRQFDIIHAHGVYDLQVDTSISSADECALAIKRRLLGPAFDAFARLKVKLSAAGEY